MTQYCFIVKAEKKVWNDVYTEHDPEYVKKNYSHRDERGAFQVDNITGGSVPKKGQSGQPWRGIDPSLVGRNWSAPQRSAWPEGVEPPDNYEKLSVHEKLDALDAAGLIYWPPKGRVPRFKRYLSTSKGKKVHDVITDISPVASKSKERTGYPTQKPLALLDRIIRASSNEGDMVLDPFCGCATACVAAEHLNRQWVGIDISPAAETITKLRLTDEAETKAGRGTGVLRKGQMPLPFDPLTDIFVHKDAPGRTDNAEEIAVQLRLPAYQTHKNELFGRQEGKCSGCQEFFRFRNLTVDHVRPQSKGGTDHIENLQVLCQACNSTKGKGTQAELISRLKEQGVLK